MPLTLTFRRVGIVTVTVTGWGGGTCRARARGRRGVAGLTAANALTHAGVECGFGRFEQVALRFAEPFWREAGFPHLMVFPRDPDEWMVWVMGQDAFGGGPVLVFFVFHSAECRSRGSNSWRNRRD